MYRDNLDSHSPYEPEYIQKIRQSCPEKLKKMQMSYEECKILSFFLKLIDANKVLELGTLIGCSTAWIAHSLSGENSKVISVEKSLNNYKIAVDNMKSAGLNSVVELINGDAIEVLESYIGKTEFDAIFIDAKKIEYSSYLSLAKICVRSGGIIIADNTFMMDKTSPDISDAILNFNKSVENDLDLDSVLIPTTAGMTVMVRK